MLVASLVAAFHSASAHQGATGIVKERMDAMSAMGDHAEIVGDMLKGKRAMERAAVKAAAETFVTEGERIVELFPDTPESRSGTATEALPAIWVERDAFEGLATDFTESSRALARVAASGDANGPSLRAAFFKTARQCRACHERFRQQQD